MPEFSSPLDLVVRRDGSGFGSHQCRQQIVPPGGGGEKGQWVRTEELGVGPLIGGTESQQGPWSRELVSWIQDVPGKGPEHLSFPGGPWGVLLPPAQVSQVLI